MDDKDQIKSDYVVDSIELMRKNKEGGKAITLAKEYVTPEQVRKIIVSSTAQKFKNLSNLELIECLREAYCILRINNVEPMYVSEEDYQWALDVFSEHRRRIVARKIQ